ncbi:hypothetical protein PSAR109036_01030 [Psychrobacter arenosus]
MPKSATADYLDRYPKLSINTYRDDLRRISKAGQTPTFNLNYTHKGKHYQYDVAVTTTPCNYGNCRYWWSCPNCHKRVGVLYKAGLYVCRHCLGLNYHSQHQHTYQRPDNRMERIRNRLDWHNNPYSKPKGMHRKTFKKLFMEYHEIEDYYMSCLNRFDAITNIKRRKRD